jgi:hypothetical protein
MLQRMGAWLFLLLAPHGAVIAAEAASPEEQANVHLQTGNERLEQGDFAGAVAAYRAGFALFPRANLLFNIGGAELRLGHLVEAAEAFEGVLARPETTPEVAALARAQLEQTDAKLVLVEVKVDPMSSGHGAALALDGEPCGNLPLGRRLRMSPGMHTLRATKAGHHPFERPVSGAPGSRLTVTIEPLVAEAPPRSRSRLWLWGTVGAAVAAAAVIGIVAVQRRGLPDCPEMDCVDFKH